MLLGLYVEQLWVSSYLSMLVPLRPGCMKPTYNGRRGGYCSKTCLNAMNGGGGSVAAAPGTPKATLFSENQCPPPTERKGVQ
eukprot:3928236-Amphidinium_carterae.1